VLAFFSTGRKIGLGFADVKILTIKQLVFINFAALYQQLINKNFKE